MTQKLFYFVGGTPLGRFVIGDVHGQFDTLMTLVGAISPRPDDRFFFLGDLIDRGPQSAQVVEWVRSHDHACIKGNHEQMCLEAYGTLDSPMLWQGWLSNGGAKTLESYGAGGITPEHLQWIRELPLYLDLGDVWLVHAGLDPRLSLEEQTALEYCWIREPFHSSTEPYFENKAIITGHTITFVFPGIRPGELAQGPGWLDIDTGAYHPRSGWLTALDLDTATVYQANSFTYDVRILPLEELAVPIRPMVEGRPNRRR